MRVAFQIFVEIWIITIEGGAVVAFGESHILPRQSCISTNRPSPRRRRRSGAGRVFEQFKDTQRVPFGEPRDGYARPHVQRPHVRRQFSRGAGHVACGPFNTDVAVAAHAAFSAFGQPFLVFCAIAASMREPESFLLPWRETACQLGQDIRSYRVLKFAASLAHTACAELQPVCCRAPTDNPSSRWRIEFQRF